MSTGPNSVSLTVENLGDWRGQDVIDNAGDKAGKLEDVFYDARRDEPAFIAVKSGLIGKKLTLVPVAGASVTRDHVRVTHAKDQIKNAPSFDPDAELTPDDESSAYGYYGLEYAAPPAGGRLLAKH
jgi:PRC-barrel domain